MTVEHGSAGSATTGSAGSTAARRTPAARRRIRQRDRADEHGQRGHDAGSARHEHRLGRGLDAVLPAVVTLTLTTTPDGAEIFINGVPTGKKTPATLQLPKTGKVDDRVPLEGLRGSRLKEIALDSDAITKDATLKKTHAGGGNR